MINLGIGFLSLLSEASLTCVGGSIISACGIGRASWDAWVAFVAEPAVPVAESCWVQSWRELLE
eukprot:2555340-Amphidinium_carterae.1